MTPGYVLMLAIAMALCAASTAVAAVKDEMSGVLAMLAGIVLFFALVHSVSYS